MQLSILIQESQKALEKVLDRAEVLFKKVSSFRPHPTMLDPIKVDYHGVLTPIYQIANIHMPKDRPRVLRIEPWDKKLLGAIAKAIYAYNQRVDDHSFSPQSTDRHVDVVLPSLTGELRERKVKKLESLYEEEKEKINEIRRNANKKLVLFQKEGVSEDECKRVKNQLQKFIEKRFHQLDQLLKEKKQEVQKI